jgi:DHA1 family bicyclomycin/chloramphenicol resistance-like MFS transporter
MIGAALAFITGSSFVFVESFGVEPQNFGFVFTAVAGAFALGSLVAGRLVRRIDGRTLFVRAAIAVAAGGIVLAAVALLGGAGVFSITAPFTVMAFAMGFIISLGIAGALAPHSGVAGTASAVLGFTQGLAAASASALVGFLFDGTAVPMALTVAVLALGVPVSFLIISPRAAR